MDRCQQSYGLPPSVHRLSHGLKIAQRFAIFTPVCALVSPFRFPYGKKRHPEGCLFLLNDIISLNVSFFNDISLPRYDIRFRRMIYLLCKCDIISVPSYAAGIYHRSQSDIISKIYHPFRQGTDIIEKTSLLS